MPIPIAVRTAKLISVHDEPSTLRLELPSITPGTYFVPGVSASKEEFDKCVFSFRDRQSVQYATLKELGGHKYVEIEVFDGKTPQYGTEFTQKLDEHGQAMTPPLVRALLAISAEEIANELERQAQFFSQNLGVKAVNHEVAVEDIVAAEKENTRYMQAVVAQTNRWSKVGGGINITEQARSHAWRLHKRGLLNPLPEWATINPEGGAETDTQNCPNCGATLSKNVSKCTQPGCGTILNWLLAVERGQVLAKDVPRSKRAEAGLDDPKTKAEMLQEVRDKVAADFKE